MSPYSAVDRFFGDIFALPLRIRGLEEVAAVFGGNLAWLSEHIAWGRFSLFGGHGGPAPTTQNRDSGWLRYFRAAGFPAPIPAHHTQF